MNLHKAFRLKRTITVSLLAAMLALLLTPGSVLAASGAVQWCPAPLPTDAGGCTDAASIQDAINLAVAAQTAGTVYVKAGSFNQDVLINKLKDVAIIGNADGGAGTTLDGGFQITGSTNIMVSNFNLNSSIYVDKGTGYLILQGNTSTTVSVSNSNFSKNTAVDGVQIIANHGPVFLNKVTATRNSADGIHIETDANVGLADIIATRNGGDGVNINAGSVSIYTDVTKLNRFDTNAGNGIALATGGSVELYDVSASGNGLDGVYTSPSAATITIRLTHAKMNHFDRNDQDGLNLVSNGPITLEDITASHNGQEGMNASSNAAVTISAVVSRMNHFDANGSDGIEIDAGAKPELFDITANANGHHGIRLSTTGGADIHSARSKLNHFDGNKSSGIVIVTDGLATIEDISASKNVSDGLLIDNQGGVLLRVGQAKKNVLDNNGDDGIDIATQADVTLVGVSASKNKDAGLEIGITTTADVDMCNSTLKSNKVFNIIAILNGGNLHLGGVVLSPATGSVSLTGGTLVTNNGCA